jgi:hypothetical protein
MAYFSRIVHAIIFIMMDSTFRAYRDRWRAVREVERQEQRAALIDLRWKQTNSILSLAIGLNLVLDHSPDQDKIVRQRWEKLRNML